VRRKQLMSGRRNIAGTALANGLLGAIGVVTGVIAARWLGPAGRGELAAIQMWPSLLASLAMLGLPDAVVYFCARHPLESKRYLVTAMVITLAVMPIFALTGYALIPRVLSAQSPRIIHGARMYLILMPIYALVGLPYQLLRGVQRYRLWNVMRLAPPFIWLGVLLAGMSLGITDPVRLTTTFLVLLAVAGPALAWIVWRHAEGPIAISRETVTNLVRFGAPSATATLSQFFNLKLDQMMVAAMLPARDLGVYMVAVSWGTCIPMISSALAMVVSTQIAAVTSASERNQRFSRGVRNGTWMIACAVVLLGAATPVGIAIVFGSAFQAAVIPAAILVIASGTNALNGVLEELLRGFGRPGATLVAESVAVAVGLPVLLLLVPRFGLAGAALASLIGYLSGTVVLFLQSRRVAGFQVWAAIDPRGIPWSNVSTLTSRALRLRFGAE
jgi:O-antigen/teichoic acid export membrane protein